MRTAMRTIAQIERGKSSVAPQCLPSSKAWECSSGQLPTHGPIDGRYLYAHRAMNVSPCGEWPHCSLSCQHPVHTRTAYTELLCNSGGAETLLAEAPDLIGSMLGFRPL